MEEESQMTELTNKAAVVAFAERYGGIPVANCRVCGKQDVCVVTAYTTDQSAVLVSCAEARLCEKVERYLVPVVDWDVRNGRMYRLKDVPPLSAKVFAETHAGQAVAPPKSWDGATAWIGGWMTSNSVLVSGSSGPLASTDSHYLRAVVETGRFRHGRLMKVEDIEFLEDQVLPEPEIESVKPVPFDAVELLEGMARWRGFRIERTYDAVGDLKFLVLCRDLDTWVQFRWDVMMPFEDEVTDETQLRRSVEYCVSAALKAWEAFQKKGE